MTVKQFILNYTNNSLKGIKRIKKLSYLLDKEISKVNQVTDYFPFWIIITTDEPKCYFYDMRSVSDARPAMFLDDRCPIR